MAKKKAEEERFGEEVADVTLDDPNVEVEEAQGLTADPPALVEEEMPPLFGQEVLIDVNATGVYTKVPAPRGYDGDAPDARISIGGKNYEHVEDRHYPGLNGGYTVWCYRRM